MPMGQSRRDLKQNMNGKCSTMNERAAFENYKNEGQRAAVQGADVSHSLFKILLPSQNQTAPAGAAQQYFVQNLGILERSFRVYLSRE
jgi:hypothetical protein